MIPRQGTRRLSDVLCVPADSPSPARTRRRCRDIRSQRRTCPRLPRGRSREPGIRFRAGRLSGRAQSACRRRSWEVLEPRERRRAYSPLPADTRWCSLFPPDNDATDPPEFEFVGAFERVDRKILPSNRKRPPGYRSGLRSRSRTRNDRRPRLPRTRRFRHRRLLPRGLGCGR